MKLNDTIPSAFQFINIIDEWKKNYHVDDKRGDIVFQNKDNLTNIRFDNHSFHNISKNTKGVENLPDTLEHPDEIWSRWEDPSKQMVVIRNYILFGSNGNYVVVTRGGIIINAIFVVKSLIDKYRRGLLLIR